MEVSRRDGVLDAGAPGLGQGFGQAVEGDIRRIKEEIFFGLTLKQILILMPGALLSAFSYMLISSKGLNTLGGWAAVFISAPFVYLSVFRYQGMTGLETLKAVMRHILLPGKYVVRKGCYADALQEAEHVQDK